MNNSLNLKQRTRFLDELMTNKEITLFSYNSEKFENKETISPILFNFILNAREQEIMLLKKIAIDGTINILDIGNIASYFEYQKIMREKNDELFLVKLRNTFDTIFNLKSFDCFRGSSAFNDDTEVSSKEIASIGYNRTITAIKVSSILLVSIGLSLGAYYYCSKYGLFDTSQAVIIEPKPFIENESVLNDINSVQMKSSIIETSPETDVNISKREKISFKPYCRQFRNSGSTVIGKFKVDISAEIEGKWKPFSKKWF